MEWVQTHYWQAARGSHFPTTTIEFQKEVNADQILRVNLAETMDKTIGLVHIQSEGYGDQQIYRHIGKKKNIHLYSRKLKDLADQLLEANIQKYTTFRCGSWQGTLKKSEVGEFGLEEVWRVVWMPKLPERMRRIELELEWFRATWGEEQYVSVEVYKVDAEGKPTEELLFFETPILSGKESENRKLVLSKVEDRLITPMEHFAHILSR